MGVLKLVERVVMVERRGGCGVARLRRSLKLLEGWHVRHTTDSRRAALLIGLVALQSQMLLIQGTAKGRHTDGRSCLGRRSLHPGRLLATEALLGDVGLISRRVQLIGSLEQGLVPAAARIDRSLAFRLI